MKDSGFRPNVALILRNEVGKLLICERTDYPGTWQFPQGGVKRGESLDEALEREVLEELGLKPSTYRVLTSKGPYRYTFPRKVKKGDYIGQEQTYFLAELNEPGPDISFGGKPPEFRAARWIEPVEFQLAHLSPMKREVYQAVFADFFGVRLV
jgi:putative (di)nucleoside polyphosphate hydrolase